MKFRYLIGLFLFWLALSANARPIAINDETETILKELFYSCGQVSEQLVFATDKRTTAILDAMLGSIQSQFIVDETMIAELKSRFFSGEVDFRSSVIGKKTNSPDWKFQSDDLSEKAAACLMV